MRLRPACLLAVTATVAGLVALPPAATAAPSASPRSAAAPVAGAEAPHAHVTGLHAEAASPDRVRLSWTFVRQDGVSAITVRRALGRVAPSAHSGSAVARLGATAHGYVDSGLIPGHAYSYAVFVGNAAGRTGPARSVLVSLPRARPSSAPAHPHVAIPNASGHVAGTVTGGGTGLGNVDVSLYSPSGDYVTDAVTNDDGTYQAAVAPSAQGYLVCFDGRYSFGGPSRTGYASECYNDQPWDRDFQSLPAGLTPVVVTSGGTSTVNADLAVGGAISGTITASSDGTGLQDAYVQVYTAGGNSIGGTSTDGHGRYRVNGLQSGSYFLCVDGTSVTTGPSAYGYVSVCYKNKPFNGFDLPAGSTAVTVTAGAIHANVNLKLAGAGAITGTVTETGGAALVDYGITVFDAQGNYVNAPNSQQGDGTYVVYGLAPGTGYTVCFDAGAASGGTSTTGYLSECYDGAAWDPGTGVPAPDATAVTVVAGTATPGVDAAVTPGAAITGTVTSAATGQGIRTVYANVYTSDGNFAAEDATDANGAYRIAGLPAGSDYVLCFDTQDARGGGSTTGYLSECYDDVPWDRNGLPAGATPVSVDAGQTVQRDAQLTVGGAIAGKVVAASGQPLSDVYVLVFDNDQNEVANAYTQATTGTYRMNGLPPSANYVVCFEASGAQGGPSAAGYRSQCYRNRAWSGEEYDLPADLTPVSVTTGAIHGAVNATLAAGGGITGTVTATGGAALSGVDVAVYKSNGDYIADTSTRVDGTYAVTGLAASSAGYVVCFAAGSNAGGPSAAGYLPECYDNVPYQDFVLPAGTTPVVVTAGSVRGGIDAALDPAGAITGTVTSAAAGQGITDVEVDAYTPDGDYVGTDYTTSNGRYQISNVDPDATGYVVCFGTYNAHGGGVASGYLPQCYDNVAWNGAELPTGTTLVPTTAGVVTTGIDAVLKPAGAIAGKVTALTGGGAVADVDVEVFDASGNYVNDAVTDGSGTFRLNGVAPSATGYDVCFDASRATGGSSATGYRSQCFNAIAWTPDAPVPATATPVSVTAGSVHANVNAKLAAGGAIAGTVTAAADGTALSDVAITVFDATGSEVAQTEVALDGTYEIRSLAPSANYVVCFAPEDQPASGTGYAAECYRNVPWDGAYDTAPAAATHVAVRGATRTSGIDAALEAGGAISGTLTSGVTGSPLARASVDVLDTNGYIGYSQTAADGTYTVRGLNPATGPYTVCFAAFDTTGSATGYARECYDNVPWNGGAVPSGTAAVAVTSATTTPGIDAALGRGGAISGTVSADGAPLPNSEVVVFTGTSEVYETETSASGTYRVNGLTPGSYTVCFFGNGDLQNQCWKNVTWDGTRTGIPASATPVPVTAGAIKGGINAVLQHPPA